MVIHIDNLRVHTVIGTFDWERHAPRELRVSVSITPKDSQAVRTDDLADGVDYAELAEKIIALGRASQFRLIEAFADAVLQLLLADPKVRLAEVEVTKPAAVPAAQSVRVTLRGVNPD
ncbi:MAG: dihydroneopterin aldolase [Phycisphaerae bacterium]|nr:dihydroneopterin aldolase [Phycisphaerae bacterium]